jgi:glycosyltransferase involved in cell wall biosynthesis
LVSLAVSHLAFIGPTVDFHPTVFLPQGGKVNSATRQRCKERNFGIRWMMYRPMMWDLLRRVDEVWTAEPNRELLKNLGLPGNDRFLNFDYGVVDTEQFYPREDAVSFVSDPGTTVIGSFRRARNPPLIPSYETFLDAVALLEERRGDFHVVIGGLYPDNTGNEVQAAIDAKVAEHGLSGRIIELDMVPKEEMSQHYSGLDIYVNFSPVNSLAGIGTASKEAMACECAFATFDDPPAGYVVNDWENGVLLEHGDVSGTADAIERLIEDSQLCDRLGQNGRETAIEMFACENVSKRIVERCRDLARNN